MATRPRLREWKRKTIVHLFRWAGLAIFVALNLGFLMTLYKVHVVMGQGLSPKEVMLIFLVGALTISLLPQTFLEANYVGIDAEYIYINNLVFGFKEKWSDLKTFWNPSALNFAVLIGKKFVYFLNKKDLQDFQYLAETIEQKGPKLLN